MNRIAFGLMFAALCATACGDDGASGDGDDTMGGEPVAETIDAAEGGEVAMGGAAVAIPADALGEDTEITIEVVDKEDLPESESIASEVYDFGPDGTIFEEPVTLTIDFDASETPEGMTAVLAWLDTEQDEWIPLPNSEVSGDTVTATTDHFTAFAVIFTVAGQVAGACEDLGESDCGGDIEGTWEFSLGCLTLPEDFLVDEETGESPFGDCPGLTFSASLDLSGTASFEADGTYALDTMQMAEILITVPKECLPMDAVCADLGDEENPAVDADDACELSMTSESVNDETGSYELDGNTVITTDDVEMVADEPNPYCVRGDTLTVETTNEDGLVTVFQATRR